LAGQVPPRAIVSSYYAGSTAASCFISPVVTAVDRRMLCFKIITLLCLPPRGWPAVHGRCVPPKIMPLTDAVCLDTTSCTRVVVHLSNF
jgi:hypothetical protein